MNNYDKASVDDMLYIKKYGIRCKEMKSIPLSGDELIDCFESDEWEWTKPY